MKHRSLEIIRDEHSSLAAMLQSMRMLVDRGYREVELLGQNVNSYAGGCTFAELLTRVARVDGLEWIRFTTSHPMNFTRELAEVLVSEPKVAPFLHLPIQSGSDAVLRRMLAKRPEDRYPDLAECKRELDAALAQDAVTGLVRR